MLVGKQAPEFILDGIVNGEITNINSLQFFGKYVLYFFYPADFSQVCPTELLALEENINEFKSRNVSVLAISPDSVYAHIEWINTPRENGGIGNVSFILLSDIKKEMARSFSILDEELGVPFRGAFIVNKSGQVVYGSVNNLYIGRNTDELVRLIDAFQFTEKHNDLCPIDWRPGESTVPSSHKGSRQYYRNKFG